MQCEKNPEFTLDGKLYNCRVGVKIPDLLSAIEDHRKIAPDRTFGPGQSKW